jgi:hypothetical protein
LNCSASSFGTEKQWHHQSLTVKYNNYVVTIPFYSNIADISTIVSDDITHAVILQHGNLRNADQYQCAGSLALSSHNATIVNTIIISTQFLVENDTCWNKESNSYINIKSSSQLSMESSCGFPIWSSEGWKDGHHATNLPGLHSYDIFNILIDHLSDPNYFPSIQKITLFGISL